MARDRTRQPTTSETPQPPRTRTRAKTLSTGTRNYESLDNLSKEVEKSIGAKVMHRGSALPGFAHIEFGVFMLDFALLGGIPEGQVSQIFGWEGSGKSTMCMRAIARAQAKHPGKAVTFIDAEHTLDPVWAEHHGIDLDNLYMVQPESGEQAVDILDAVLRANDTAMVVLDSLPALVPQKEIDSSTEDALVARRAQLIGRACSKILAATQSQRVKGNYPSTLFVNQWRSKIGVVYGSPNTLPGGNQPRFLSTTMIEVKKKKEHLTKDASEIEIVSHNEHAFKIRKSKVGNSLRSGEFTMICDPDHTLGQGAMDEGRTVVTYAKRMGVVSGGGSSWYLDGVDRKFGNMQGIVDYLEQDDFEYSMLKARLVAMRRQHVGIRAVPHDGYLMGMTEEELSERMDVKL